jgi:iron complex transport system ATP-binding protein
LLSVEKAICGYGRGGARKVLDGISFRLAPGEILCVLGVNGVGKTTLFRTLIGSLPLAGGGISIDGKAIGGLSRRELARKIGYVPQAHSPPFPFTVEQVTVMGRAAHLDLFSAPSGKDLRIAREALDAAGVLPLKDRAYTEISGGERQLTLIARAFAQQAAYLVMDEPTANLDLGNRMRILRKIKELAAAGIGVIMSSHDPDQALLIAGKAVVIRGASDFVLGETEEVLTRELIREIYGVEASLMEGESPDGERARGMIAFLGAKV